MGAYLERPVTKKHTEVGEYTKAGWKVKFGAAAMQGWRISMEDAHAIIPHFDDRSSLFAVYDGHGGKEVALYCAKTIPHLLLRSESYGQGDYVSALKNAFMSCDHQLLSKEAVQEMKEMLYQNNDLGDEDEPTPADLIREATMPLEDILAQYSDWIQLKECKEEEGNRPGFVLKILASGAGGVADDESSEDSSSNSPLQDGPSQDGKQSPFEPEGDGSQARVAGSGFSCVGSAGPSTSCVGPCASCATDQSESRASSLPQILDGSKPGLLVDLLTSRLSEADGDPLSRKHPREASDACVDAPGVQVGRSAKRVCRRPSDKEGFHSGTTAVVCLLRGAEGGCRGTLFVANAGDSRCVLSSDGQAIDLSEDHKPSDQFELERIQAAGGCVEADGRVNGGLNLSRALGDHFYKQNKTLPLESQMISALPDVRTHKMTSRDEFLVLACDGIWNSKSSQEVVDFVRLRLQEKAGVCDAHYLSHVSKALCDACLAPNTDNDGTGCDNMTCVIVQLLSSPPVS